MMYEELLDDKYEEYIRLRNYNLTKEIKENHKLLHVALEVTQRCNAKCAHCFISCDEKLRDEELTLDDYKRVLDEIATHYNPKDICIAFTGGEPLVRDDLSDIILYAKNLGFIMTITTNGSLLTDKLIEFYHENNVVNIAISIDGLQKTHEELRKLPGCYPKLLKSIKKIMDVGICAGVTTVVNKKNIGELEGLYKQFCDIGLHYWRIFGIDPEGRANENKEILLDKDDYDYMYNFVERVQKENKLSATIGCGYFLGFKYERKVRKNGCYLCGTGSQIASILSNGDIFGCSNIPRVKKLIQGNVKTDSFVDVWENKFQIYRDINARKGKQCSLCKYWRYCLGGGMHTWDPEKNMPNVCMRKILKF